MSRNHLNVSDLMEELEEIERTTRFDLSKLMGALEYIENNPTISKEEAEKIKQEVETEVKELRRSVRIAAAAARKASAIKQSHNKDASTRFSTRTAVTAFRRPRTTVRRVKQNLRKRSRRWMVRKQGPVRLTRYKKNPIRNGQTRRVRAIMPKSRRQKIPESEKRKSTRHKSILEKAQYIIHKQNEPLTNNESKKGYQITGYMDKLDLLRKFRYEYPENDNIELINEAIEILQRKLGLSGPVASAAAMANNSVPATATASMARMTSQLSGKPLSEILTGKAKGKSLHAQALTILKTPDEIRKSRFIPYLKDQHDTFDEFIRTHPENHHIHDLIRAKNILLTNPQVNRLVNPQDNALVNPGAATGSMKNNNNL